MLRSANYRELVEPGMRGKCYGPRSFRVAAHSISAQKCVNVVQFHVLPNACNTADARKLLLLQCVWLVVDFNSNL